MTASLRLPSRQRGSTLTGIIIGLIIGLGIAVVVALMITKGASPFTDRSNKMGRPADLEPSLANDPNKPMYGNRDAAREAAKQLAEREAKKAAAAAAPPPPAPAAATESDPLGQAIAGMTAASEPKPAAPAAPAPAAAPAGAPAAPAAPAAGGDDKYIYYLQAGAFREMSDAENTRAKLALLGFEAAITDRASDSGTLHRVRLGPFNQVEAVNKARAKLLDSGIDVAIVRNQK
ncbi:MULTISPECIES: SPOR domain-containing protein [unclassified Massilia]|uniref:SPOR domain-containing protein n=1 Tax=unclassified Massilia TaxID=2609279 RepID=UPI001787372D|nr:MULTISPECIES: SPOR domain-containing protein [unclassified Massilia]MBD8530613.1 SPOR domain-containing protein [Massilia sp. CFBP 13647]MBD8674838.1 SPOR domain-containing protein [Massilia sp. CFBP 13721]